MKTDVLGTFIDGHVRGTEVNDGGGVSDTETNLLRPYGVVGRVGRCLREATQG